MANKKFYGDEAYGTICKSISPVEDLKTEEIHRPIREKETCSGVLSTARGWKERRWLDFVCIRSDVRIRTWKRRIYRRSIRGHKAATVSRTEGCS